MKNSGYSRVSRRRIRGYNTDASADKAAPSLPKPVPRAHKKSGPVRSGAGAGRTKATQLKQVPPVDITTKKTSAKGAGTGKTKSSKPKQAPPTSKKKGAGAGKARSSHPKAAFTANNKAKAVASNGQASKGPPPRARAGAGGKESIAIKREATSPPPSTPPPHKYAERNAASRTAKQRAARPETPTVAGRRANAHHVPVHRRGDGAWVGVRAGRKGGNDEAGALAGRKRATAGAGATTPYRHTTLPPTYTQRPGSESAQAMAGVCEVPKCSPVETPAAERVGMGGGVGAAAASAGGSASGSAAAASSAVPPAFASVATTPTKGNSEVDACLTPFPSPGTVAFIIAAAATLPGAYADGAAFYDSEASVRTAIAVDPPMHGATYFSSSDSSSGSDTGRDTDDDSSGDGDNDDDDDDDSDSDSDDDSSNSSGSDNNVAQDMDQERESDQNGPLHTHPWLRWDMAGDGWEPARSYAELDDPGPALWSGTYSPKMRRSDVPTPTVVSPADIFEHNVAGMMSMNELDRIVGLSGESAEAAKFVRKKLSTRKPVCRPPPSFLEVPSVIEAGHRCQGLGSPLRRAANTQASNLRTAIVDRLLMPPPLRLAVADTSGGVAA